MIDQSTIQRIKDAAGVLDVLGEFLDIRKKGKDYEALCPFHDDRHYGSFKISVARNCYTCFSCGHHGGPVDFLMEHARLSYPDAIRWLGQKYGIETDNNGKFYNLKTCKPHTPPPPLPMLVINPKFVAARCDVKENTLYRWIRSLPWCGAGAARIDGVFDIYRVGHSKYGHTIFWQIDDEYRVRTGKMMMYKMDGHRDKETPHNYDWIHSSLGRAGLVDLNQYEMRTCFFGQHLLNVFPNANINIVESEKTALIMSIAYGDPKSQIWLASGGKSMLTREKMEPLIKTGRYITLFPDRDAIEEWREQMEWIDYDRLRLNDELLKKYWKQEDGEKADIADLMVRWVMEGKKPKAKSLDDLLEQSEALKKLNEHFNFNSIWAKKDTKQ